MRPIQHRSRSRGMPWAWHQATAAAREADYLRRIALPPRPGDEPPGHERCRITIDAPGLYYVLELRAPLDRHARSDQHTVVQDGSVVADLQGRTEIGRRVAKLLPRMATKMQRHQIDRINEDC